MQLMAFCAWINPCSAAAINECEADVYVQEQCSSKASSLKCKCWVFAVWTVK